MKVNALAPAGSADTSAVMRFLAFIACKHSHSSAAACKWLNASSVQFPS